MALILGPFLFSVIQARPVAITMMGAVQSQSVYRGALIWPKGSLLIGPSFTFFNRLRLAGPSLNYSHFKREDPWELNIGLRYFDDEKPLISLGSHDKDHRNQRKNSLNFKIGGKYKFGDKKKFSIGALLSKDLIYYRGLYSKLSFKTPLFPLCFLTADLGIAENKTAKYLYGPEAKSGPGHIDMAFNTIIPFVPWDGIAVISLKKSWIIQKENKESDYIRGDDKQLTFGTRLFWNIF